MEMCKDESQAAVTQKKSLNGEKKSRPVLVSSEKNNVTPINGKPRTREVTSRYKSSNTSTTRCSSPNASKQTNGIGTHRSISVERKRPTTPSSPTRCFVPSSPPSTPSSKSSRLSSPSSLSSQSSRPTTPVRDTMDERLTSSRRSLVGRTPDGLWPSIRSLSSTFQSDTSSIHSSKNNTVPRNPSPDPMVKSSETKKTLAVEGSHVKAAYQLRWPSMIGGNMLTRSMDLMDKATRSPSLSASARGFSPLRRFRTSLIDVAPPTSPKVSEKSSHLVSSSRTTSSTRHRSPSPTPGLVCPSSPNKASSVSRAMSSPTRSRPSSPCSSSSSILTRDGVSSSMLNYIVDVRKGKSPSQIEIAHHLRLLHTRDLQWRFVNARAESAISTQYLVSEASLHNAWGITLEIRDAIIMKRMNVHYIRREISLKSILNEQIAYLEDWNELEGEHSNSLLGTTEALKASTLCLPIAGHTWANACDVKNAISSAADVMQAMGSSICYLLSKVENANSVIFELSELAASESIMLDQCRELVALAAEMQVQECSLKTQITQLKQQNVQVG